MSDMRTRFLNSVAVVALGAATVTANGQTPKKTKTPAAPAATQTAPATPVTSLKPAEPTPAQKYQMGETFVDKSYDTFLPPLPAAALVGPDTAPRQQPGAFGIHLGLGGKKSETEGLISGVAKDLDTFIQTAKELQQKSAFVEGGDPYLNGVKVEATRVFALHAQAAMDGFKENVPLEQFLNQSNRHDIAQKVTLASKDANYTDAFKMDPKAAAKMLQDTIDQAEGLATGLRVSIGEAKSAQKSTGFGNLTASIINGTRTQNRVYTGVEANKANYMSALLKQNETAFGAILTNPTVDGPSNPYGAPTAPAQPVNPYGPSTPPAKPAAPFEGTPKAGLQIILLPANTGMKFTYSA